MTNQTVPPTELDAEQVAQLLREGRERAAAAELRARVITALRQHFDVTIEPPDAAFDRAMVLVVQGGGDKWNVNVSLAADYAYVLREDTSEIELITPDSDELESTERTLFDVLTTHGLRVLTLDELQRGIDTDDAGVSNVYELCFQEGGDAFWSFGWFQGQA